MDFLNYYFSEIQVFMPLRRRRPNPSLNIPDKANRVLNLVLIGLVLIVMRIWHLGVVQHEERLEESRKPQRRVVVEPAKRGTIRDRFNIPLAINKVQYNATVVYSQIRQVPSIAWRTEEGKRVKRYRRREYIEELSQLLGEELQLDSERVEDLIHSKAALYNSLPYIIKADITEREYYRLKMLEKDWLGIQVQCVPKRDYPFGNVAGDIIGYMGAISREEYENVVHEIKSLGSFLDQTEVLEELSLPPGIGSVEEAEHRLRDLMEHAYSINDYVGKAGVEGRFEEKLRGYHGKKSYYSDARGNFLREMPDASDPQSGSRFLLTLSVELQAFAEKLLMQNERVRAPRVSAVDVAGKEGSPNKQPWIKGGAIVALDPLTGDVVAMASYPRFTPNDFIASGNPEVSKVKNRNINRWFETEAYLAEVWDQLRPLERERHDDANDVVVEEKAWMSWEKYLEFVLPLDSPVLSGIQRIKTIENACWLQQRVEALQALTGQDSLYPLLNEIYRGRGHQPHGRRLPAVQQEDMEERLQENAESVLAVKRDLDVYFAGLWNNYDKVLLVDLCRLAVDGERFSEDLLRTVGKQTLSEYRQASAAWVAVEKTVCIMTKELYHDLYFKPWREQNQQAFLKAKRLEEKNAGVRYPKPYLDLLDKEGRRGFEAFWEEHRWAMLAAFLTGSIDPADPALRPYCNHLATWREELDSGAHQAISWREAYAALRNVVDPLPARLVVPYLQSLRGFSDLGRPLLGKYRHVRQQDGKQQEKHLAAAFYPVYGFGYARSHAYRQATTQGSIFKLITAYETLVQRYQKLDKGPINYAALNPLTIVDNTHKKGKASYIGYTDDGRRIPQLYKGGRIPRSHTDGIGKVDLVKALELSSNPYFSLLAVDHLNNPDDLAEAARTFCFGSRTGIDLTAEIPGRVPYDLDCNRNGLYAMAVGQHSLVVTPLQTAVMLAALANGGKIMKPRLVNMEVGRVQQGPHEFSQPVVNTYPTVIKKEIFMPAAVRSILLEGMRRVVERGQASTWGSFYRLYKDYPEAISDYLDLKGQLVGKSSTAESVENVDLDLNSGTNLYNHIWFGGISFDAKRADIPETFVLRDRFGKPELVVVVYLRYGAWGKDAAPLAAQVVQKWRELKEKGLQEYTSGR